MIIPLEEYIIETQFWQAFHEITHYLSLLSVSVNIFVALEKQKTVVRQG
jgi:hypothetical protein